MKNILILTDFSANADHAAMTGAMFARHMHANILIFNTNAIQSVAPVYAGGPTVIDEIGYMEEESNERLKKLSDSVKSFLDDGTPGKKPIVHYEEALGSLAYKVKEIIEAQNIELVVMGARKGSRFDHFLTGSDTFSVIDHSSKPILIVPHNSDLTNLKKVIFATNFAAADITAVQYLIKLGLVFNYSIELVHINLLGEDAVIKDLRKKEFIENLQRLQYTNLTITELDGKNIIDRLNKLCDDSGTEILAFSHYKNSFFSRLLSQSTTRKALENQKAPLLVFPAEMNKY